LEDIQAAHPAEVKVKVKHRSKCVFDAVRLVKRIGVCPPNTGVYKGGIN
jgi:hypothetical protein